MKALGEVACISQPLHKHNVKRFTEHVQVLVFGTSKFSVQTFEIVKGASQWHH